MQTSIILALTIFSTFFTCLHAQQVERKRWHTFPENAGPILQSARKSMVQLYRQPSSPDFSGGCVFSLEEGIGRYRIFQNGLDLGQFPGDVKISPNGDVLLPEFIDGQTYVRVNGQKHGPFKQIKSYESSNGHVVVQHSDPATQMNYLYIDSVTVAESKSSFFYWGATPLVWTETTNITKEDIHTRDSLICRSCHMPNFSAVGNHYFLIYYTVDKNAMHCIVDGKDLGIIESYWAPQIDDWGHLYMPCEIKGQAYVKTEKTLFGPVKSQKTMKFASGRFGLLFTYQKPDDPANRPWLYNNGTVYGPWDSLRLFGGNNLYYYEHNGGKYLGREGKIVYAFEPGNGLKNITFNAEGQYMFACNDGTVFLNEQKLGKFLNIREMWLHQSGSYFLLYGPKTGVLTANINGKTIDFDAGDLVPYTSGRSFPYMPGNILLDDTYQHFLLTSHQHDYFIIDGKKYPCVPQKTHFFYLKPINSFCWATMEGRELYWHSLKLE
jgi:hypothetical protein